jgi:broad specificity phosphatase PhoE
MNPAADAMKRDELTANIESSATRILLIRHGETDWNRMGRFQGRSDLLLNQQGRNQARALALALKDEFITAIYTSPLLRAVETARAIGVFHPSAPVIEEKGLVEMDLGEFEGMEGHRWAAEYSDFRKAWQANPASVTMPGGESLRQVQTRAVATLGRITRLYPPESTLLLCSHNFINLTLLCCALKVPLERFRELRQGTAAINVLYLQGERLWATVVNERSHLEKYCPNRNQ